MNKKIMNSIKSGIGSYVLLILFNYIIYLVSGWSITEQMIPSLLKELRDTEPNFQADYDDKKDLKELLSLSDKNSKIPNVNSWETVLPLYPLSPFN